MDPKQTKPLVEMRLVDGPSQGEVIAFNEQDTFTIGRAADCSCVVTGDRTFSRHHLLVEVNQTNVSLKDLGSRNGTKVNGRSFGGRDKSVAPEDAEPSPPVAIRDGDEIRAGRHVMIVAIHAPTLCVDCGREVPREERKDAEFINGTFLCKDCRRKEDERNRKPEPPKKVDDVRMNRQEREAAEQRPGLVVDQLLQRLLGVLQNNKEAPAIQGYSDWQKIGEGGFGAVYKARRNSDGTIVAIKTMLQTRKPPKRQMKMFQREIALALQLDHPNIICSRNAGVFNDIHFIEMELAEGSVWDLMSDGRKCLALNVAGPIMLDALSGLAYLHKVSLSVKTKKGEQSVKGLVHRDLKPPNILLKTENGKRVAKLSDYGLAKAFTAAGFTQTGLTTEAGPAGCCGSPPYMSPEHIIEYKYAKPATDVFEMAATFFHMLTGQFVWNVRRGEEVIKVILEGQPRRLKDYLPGAPRGLCFVLDQALERDAKNRYRDGHEFLHALQKVL